jgi:ribosomal protein S4E
MDLVAAATTKEELRVIYADAKKLGLKAVEDAVTLKADKLTE